jgi:hypothetical protein
MRRIRRRLVVTGVSVDLYARVVKGEPLTGFGIDDRAKWLFLQLACARALYTL